MELNSERSGWLKRGALGEGVGATIAEGKVPGLEMAFFDPAHHAANERSRVLPEPVEKSGERFLAGAKCGMSPIVCRQSLDFYETCEVCEMVIDKSE